MNIIEKIKKGEKITTEFKECKNDVPKSLFESVCAFLNRMGGDVFLGVKDDKSVVGIDSDCAAKIKKDIASAFNNPNKISPTIYLNIDEYNIDGKIVLHFYVPESSQVHSTSGKIFDRNEDGDFNITGNTNLIAQMYIRKQREFTENTIYPYATINNLDEASINQARIMAVNRQPNHPWEQLTNEELLKSCGLYRDDYQTGKSGYSLACILLFGKDETIMSVVPYYKTDAIYRKVNIDRYDDRDEIKCNIIKSYSRLMSFIEKHLDDKFYLEGDQRIDVRNKLFREIVANLLIHREYSSAYPAKLIISGDKVVTENGNKARGYGVVNLNDFNPYPKNPVIASVFKEIGWADELGSGVRNIKKYSAIYSGIAPEFEEGDIFRTTIYTANDSEEEIVGVNDSDVGLNVGVNDSDVGLNVGVNDSDVGLNVGINDGDVGLNVGINDGDVGLNFTTTRQATLALINENPNITAEQIAEKQNVTLRTVERVIAALKKEGIIERVGSRKTGYWKVIK